MKEAIVIALFILAVVTLVVVTVVWWLKAYKNDDYIRNDDYVITDFYTHGKRIDDV